MIDLLLQLMNLADWPLPPGPLSYLLVSLLWLTIPAFFFATLVLYRFREQGLAAQRGAAAGVAQRASIGVW